VLHRVRISDGNTRAAAAEPRAHVCPAVHTGPHWPMVALAGAARELATAGAA